MSIEGMDIEAVRSFASQLTSDANEIETLVSQLNSQVSNLQSQWIGPDATKFAAEWDSTYRPQLQSVSTALHEAASVANSNAQQQETASNS
jgi:WXG100 family type VII secretion target